MRCTCRSAGRAVAECGVRCRRSPGFIALGRYRNNTGTRSNWKGVATINIACRSMQLRQVLGGGEIREEEKGEEGGGVLLQGTGRGEDTLAVDRHRSGV